MREIALELGFPENKILELDCGKRGVGNTKTQFIEMERDSRFHTLRFVTFVTNAYHAPRVKRTARKNLFTIKNYDIVGIPQEEHRVKVYPKARGEIKRIIRHSYKGEIAR